jgi:phosphocarrier protein
VDIELHYQDKVVDLKSILALMSLAVPHGENVRIIARGTRAEEAIKDVSGILG